MDEIKISIIGLLICFVLVWFISCAESNSVESEVHKYKYIIVNGQEYVTAYIESVEYSHRYRANGVLEFHLKDGTIVRCQEGQYTLTNTSTGDDKE